MSPTMMRTVRQRYHGWRKAFGFHHFGGTGRPGSAWGLRGKRGLPINGGGHGDRGGMAEHHHRRRGSQVRKSDAMIHGGRRRLCQKVVTLERRTRYVFSSVCGACRGRTVKNVTGSVFFFFCEKSSWNPENLPLGRFSSITYMRDPVAAYVASVVCGDVLS
jgi:hypothetical protein